MDDPPIETGDDATWAIVEQLRILNATMTAFVEQVIVQGMNGPFVIDPKRHAYLGKLAKEEINRCPSPNP